jgi:glycosyltransferase involved in cell wall biosynthesis
MQAYVQRPERCVTVYSGIDLKKFEGIVNDHRLRKEYNTSDSTILIGNTAALEKEKDLFTFIKTISLLIKEKINVHGVLIGEGSLRQELTEFAKTLNIASDIVFTGYRNDVRECLAGLNVFMITSEEEGLGTSVLDAFAAGIPVVATNAGGIPEMVIHEQTGLLANVKSDQQLAENIKRLITNSALQKSLTAAAAQKLHEFSKEEMAKKTFEVYKLVVSEN